MPHEFGGAGAPYEKQLYQYFNHFEPENDLAIIKPKFTTKNEFKVELPSNKYLEAPEDDGDEGGAGGLDLIAHNSLNFSNLNN